MLTHGIIVTYLQYSEHCFMWCNTHDNCFFLTKDALNEKRAGYNTLARCVPEVGLEPTRP